MSFSKTAFIPTKPPLLWLRAATADSVNVLQVLQPQTGLIESDSTNRVVLIRGMPIFRNKPLIREHQVFQKFSIHSSPRNDKPRHNSIVAQVAASAASDKNFCRR